MKSSCHGCGVEKDPAVLEISPYHEEDRLDDEPIYPLLEIDIHRHGSTEWREAMVCHECFHKLEMDMWTGEKFWAGIGPVVAFDCLPVKEME